MSYYFGLKRVVTQAKLVEGWTNEQKRCARRPKMVTVANQVRGRVAGGGWSESGLRECARGTAVFWG